MSAVVWHQDNKGGWHTERKDTGGVMLTARSWRDGEFAAQVWGNHPMLCPDTADREQKRIGITDAIDEAKIVAERWYERAVEQAGESLEIYSQILDFLLGIWSRETGWIASPRERATHPAYRAIVSLRDQMVPPLIARLRTNPYDTIGLLHEITGLEPWAKEDFHDVGRIADAWLAWWNENGWWDVEVLEPSSEIEEKE